MNTQKQLSREESMKTWACEYKHEECPQCEKMVLSSSIVEMDFECGERTMVIEICRSCLLRKVTRAVDEIH